MIRLLVGEVLFEVVREFPMQTKQDSRVEDEEFALRYPECLALCLVVCFLHLLDRKETNFGFFSPQRGLLTQVIGSRLDRT